MNAILRSVFSFLRRTWKPGALWLLGLLVVLHIGASVALSAAINQALEADRKKGEPLSLAEALTPPQDEALNAASLYKKADSLLNKAARTNVDGGGRYRLMPEEVVKENAASLELIRQASKMAYCHFEVDFSDPIRALLPHLPMLRRLSLLLRDQAIYEARHGDGQAAREDVLALFRLAKQADNEPILITYLITRSIQNYGFEALAETLRQGPLSPDQGQELLTSLPVGDDPVRLAKLLRTERSFGLWCFERLPQSPLTWSRLEGEGGDYRTHSAWSYPVELLYTPVARMDERCYLERMDQAVEAVQQPLFSEAVEDLDRTLSDAPRLAIGTRVMTPSLSGIIRHTRQAEVRRREAIIAIALARYHTAHHAYPSSLTGIRTAEGDLPEDPFTHGPFVYHSTASGFDLYSLGANRKDENGKSNGGADDIEWPHSL